MTQDQFRQMQKVQLTIMDDIHRVCAENGLKYYMIGGTALGAARHKGFIPWDVDIDIAMPREDYEKFVTDFSQHLSPKHICHDYRTDKNHFSPHAIVALKNSKVNVAGSEKNPRITYGGYGLYVDILPLDQVPDDQEQRNQHIKELQRIAKWRRLKSCEIYESNGYFAAAIKFMVSLLIPVSLYKINKKQQEIAQMFNQLPSSDCSCLCSTLSHYKYPKLCVRKTIWGTPKLYEFEGRLYYGQEDIKAYLLHLFGDYMKLPSEKHRQDCMNYISYVSWIDEDGFHELK